MTILQIAALLYLLFYCCILVGFRTYLLYRRTGINAIKSRKKTGTAGFIERVLRVCFVLLFVVVINFVFLENNYKLLIPIPYLEIASISYTGIFLSMIGLSFGFIAQLQMGDSWRLGLNDSEKTKLIDHGVYGYSRNPIYLAYMVSNLGFFMMMPNAISLCILFLSYVSLEIKIKLEEKYLLEKKGDEYENYLNRVRRWI